MNLVQNVATTVLDCVLCVMAGKTSNPLADLLYYRDMAEYRYNTKHYCGQRLSLTSPVQKGGISATCTNCGKRAWLKRVKGEFNPDHKCDVRCTSAHGNKCVCACGGANHGRDHGITQVVAVESGRNEERGAPYGEGHYTRKHLGEEGKHITGEVTVRTRKLISASILYVFVTKDGDTIKWFAPSFADPQWDEGYQTKIRAKVKRHDTHPDFGKSTIVTYVEEIS